MKPNHPKNGLVLVKRQATLSSGYRLNKFVTMLSIRYTSAEMRAQILNQVRPLMYSNELYVSILPDELPDELPERKPFIYR